ncbi:MAG: hypothetical protein ABJQ14_13165, partial [Hyphomicrobiales bacterium]
NNHISGWSGKGEGLTVKRGQTRTLAIVVEEGMVERKIGGDRSRRTSLFLIFKTMVDGGSLFRDPFSGNRKIRGRGNRLQVFCMFSMVFP